MPQKVSSCLGLGVGLGRGLVMGVRSGRARDRARARARDGGSKWPEELLVLCGNHLGVLHQVLVQRGGPRLG